MEMLEIKLTEYNNDNYEINNLSINASHIMEQYLFNLVSGDQDLNLIGDTIIVNDIRPLYVKSYSCKNNTISIYMHDYSTLTISLISE